MNLKKYGQGLFLSPKNTEEGDIITFTEEGLEGDYEGKSNVTFEVELDGDVKKITLNPTSVQNLAEAWGWESSDWIGKSAKITFVEKPIQEELVKYIVLVPASEVELKDAEIGAEEVDDSDIPVLEDEEKEIKPRVKKKVE